MRKFRKIVPPIALLICAGLLISFAGYAGMVDSPKPDRLDEINQLAFQSIQFDVQSLFTRQTGESESESIDETLRQDSKVFNALVSRELSKCVSSSVLLISSQLPPIHIPGGNRCILYSRLII